MVIVEASFTIPSHPNSTRERAEVRKPFQLILACVKDSGFRLLSEFKLLGALICGNVHLTQPRVEEQLTGRQVITTPLRHQRKTAPAQPHDQKARSSDPRSGNQIGHLASAIDCK
jgi:hypothetical protein